MPFPELDRLRLFMTVEEPRASRTTSPLLPRQGEKFLRGPVPILWLGRAASQPGRALHVAVTLWFLAGLAKSRVVRLSVKTLSVFGVDRYAAYRGLRALERAGLVEARRRRGANAIVTLLEWPASDSVPAGTVCMVGKMTSGAQPGRTNGGGIHRPDGEERDYEK
jgi:hypothetical protein